MRNKGLTLAALAAASLFATAAPANAAALVLDGGWQPFTFGGVGSSWSDSFTFTIAERSLLKITDAFQAGDQFQVLVSGPSEFTLPTSVPTGFGDQIGADYDAAYADPRWSSLGIELAAGSYTVSGTTLVSPFLGGGAAIELESLAAAVPEPATWAMMIGGFGLAGGALRRRKAKLSVTYA